MELPRPQVTVTDPREPGALVPAAEPAAARLGRRGATLLAAAGLVGATALVAADVVRDRADAVEQRRLDGVLDVTVGEGDGAWSSSHDARTGTGTVEGTVRLVNRGPRDVRITGAQLGRTRAADGPVLPAGGDGSLVLSGTVACPTDGSPPPPEPEVRSLRLSLETPAGPRQLVLEGPGLPRGSLDESVQEACLHPPLGESVDVAATVVRAEERAVVLRVDVTNDGRTPARLLSLIPARGLLAESVASAEGDATGLPLVLPVRTGPVPVVRTLEVRLVVTCGALLGADLLRPFEELSAIVEDEDRSQLTSIGVLSRDPDRQLRQLAGRTCASG